MADELYKPYAWQSARSKASTTRGAITNTKVEEMAAAGRRPSYDSKGSVRGFRSRPGAPHSEQDTMTNLGVAGDVNSPDRATAWSAFFKPPAPMAAPGVPPPVVTPPGDYMGADLSALPPTMPQQHITSAIAGNTDWMKRNGLPVPPQPSVIPTGGAAQPGAFNYRSRFGTASVSYGQPKASVSNPWGKPIPLS